LRHPHGNPKDPDLLQLIGAAADLLGLGEHLQRLLPVDRIRAQSRHRRIQRLRGAFLEHLDDARSALRVVSSVIEKRVAGDSAGFVVEIPASELPVFRRGLDWLQVSIRAMTRDAYELETITASMPEEVQRYYRMSDAGHTVLEQIRAALDGSAERTEELLQSIDRYLIRCSEIFSEGEEWRRL
jgi:hypothetical protein